MKIQAHQDAMRDVEQRLVGMVSTGDPSTDPAMGAACMVPTITNVDLTVDDLYAKAGQMQMDLAAAALACDQTRILTFQWSYSESEHLFQFLNDIQGNHHAISHDFSSSGTNYDAYNAIQTWYAEQFAYFLGKLDSYPEGDGTVLDNSLVLWATRDWRVHATRPHVDALRVRGQRRRQDPRRDGSSTGATTVRTTIRCSSPLRTRWAPIRSRPSANPSGATGPLPDLT